MSMSPAHTVRWPARRCLLSSIASAGMVPAPHIGSSNTISGPNPASRTIAAATVGRSDAGRCSALYVRCRMVRSVRRTPHTAVVPLIVSQISTEAFSSAGFHDAGKMPPRPWASAPRASVRM